ncbi:hypothetical protein KDM90_17670, partial [Undibacterium sp. FT137W]|nr:hypothetical protein [Undibacterium fentianense]
HSILVQAALDSEQEGAQGQRQFHIEDASMAAGVSTLSTGHPGGATAVLLGTSAVPARGRRLSRMLRRRVPPAIDTWRLHHNTYLLQPWRESYPGGE